jgi:hypothetical protein
MKPTAKINLLMLIGFIFMWINILAKPLGIPSSLQSIPILIAAVFLCLGILASKKAKVAGQIPEQTEFQKRKRFSVMVATLGATCVTIPFVLPLITDVTMSFGELVVISGFTFFMLVGVFWLTMKMKK